MSWRKAHRRGVAAERANAARLTRRAAALERVMSRVECAGSAPTTATLALRDAGAPDWGAAEQQCRAVDGALSLVAVPFSVNLAHEEEEEASLRGAQRRSCADAKGV